MPPPNLRYTPEQYAEKKQLDAERDRKGRILSMAARFLAARLAANGVYAELGTELDLREHARKALHTAYVLLDEADSFRPRLEPREVSK